MNATMVRALRAQLGLSVAELAEELRLVDPAGSGARHVREWESGAREITGPASRALELLAERHHTSRPPRHHR